MDIELFKELANVFYEHGFDLYLVGGSVRDYLLTSSFSDADCATNATLDEMKTFLEIKSEFKLFESGKFFFKNKVFDITSMRIETNYEDFRHPKIIERVFSPEKEFVRRDFTINALYMTKEGQILDFCNGVNDLNKRIIRCIGNPDIRIKEDPLRILRAIRFAYLLDFEIEKDLLNAINDNLDLLKKINYSKIKEELRKFKLEDIKLHTLLKKYNIDKVIPLNYFKGFKKAISYLEYQKGVSVLNLLNKIQNSETFINIINVNSFEELVCLRKELEDYKTFIEEIKSTTNLDQCFSQRKYLYILKCDGLKKENKEMILANTDLDKIRFLDDDYNNIESKKNRNKLYYETFVNLLKQLDKK